MAKKWFNQLPYSADAKAILCRVFRGYCNWQSQEHACRRAWDSLENS